MDIIAHLSNRNFMPLYYPNFLTVNNMAYFPLYTFDYKYAGYQQYNPLGDKLERKNPYLGKYFTKMTKPAVWGLEFVRNEPFIIVTEGVFKACRFHNYNLPAIAVLSNNPTYLKEQFNLLKLTKTIIVVCDPDNAGKKLCKYGDICIIPSIPIDEMSSFEFYHFLQKELNPFYLNNIV